MAENAAPATVSLTPEQEKKVYAPEQTWSDDFALKVVVQDFQRAESYRTANHDWRWREHDRLYEAWTQQLYWEGTNVPRSSVPVFLAFQQIEAILPKLLSAIFSDNPWFQTDPLTGTPAAEARAAQNVVLQQMEQAHVREIFRRWIKSGLIYGNGVMELCWLQRQTKRKRYHARYEPRQDEFGQLDGFDRIMELKDVTEIENRPELRVVSIKDFYIDPNCPSPLPQDARYCLKRVLATVDQIDRLRDNDEFKIPSKDILTEMAKHKTVAQGDMTKTSTETARAGYWNPSTDQTVDPGGKRLEMLCYWSEDRSVYVLDRRHVAYNQTNPYGFMPFYNFPYADMLDRFYAMGICDVLEGEQRLQSSILNARIDELALNIHRPMVKRRGLPIPNYMLRQRPGQVLEADNPREDFYFPEMPQVTGQAFVEVQASENRAQKVSGVTDLAVLGTPSAGGNSASRTATGVNSQVAASTSRLQYLVENAESLGIEPLLNDIWRLNQLYPPLGGIPVQGEQGQYRMRPDVIINSNVKFAMRASAKMQSKQALLQVFPLVMQSLSNPAFMQQLAEQNLAINFVELMNMLLDTTGYRLRADLIRPLSQQEQQQRQQPPADQMLRMQMQRERLQGEAQRLQAQLQAKATESDEDRQAEMIKTILPHALTSLHGEEPPA